MVRDIVYYLGLRDPVQVRGVLLPEKLYYAVVTDIEKDKRLYQSVHKLQGSGIVYVSSRAAAVEVAQKLRKWGFSALPYHAGMEAALRAQTQEAWIQEKVRLIVATTAFGMGIDKPNTRFVIHYDLALEPEAYFQEVGRAGRDGELAYAIALYSPRDVEGLHRRLEEKYPSPDFLLRLYQVVKQEAGQGAIRVALPAWAEWLKVRPGVLRRAFHLLAQEGLIFWRESWDGRAYLRSFSAARNLAGRALRKSPVDSAFRWGGSFPGRRLHRPGRMDLSIRLAAGHSSTRRWKSYRPPTCYIIRPSRPQEGELERGAAASFADPLASSSDTSIARSFSKLMFGRVS